MYNRYIPSTDGGYICRRVEDTPPHPIAQTPQIPVEQPEVQARAEQAPCPEPCDTPPAKQGLLQRLFPKNLDVDDILILLILILLLLDSEESDDTLTVLLTVAAFLIL